MQWVVCVMLPLLLNTFIYLWLSERVSCHCEWKVRLIVIVANLLTGGDYPDGNAINEFTCMKWKACLLNHDPCEQGRDVFFEFQEGKSEHLFLWIHSQIAETLVPLTSLRRRRWRSSLSLASDLLFGLQASGARSLFCAWCLWHCAETRRHPSD